VNAVKGAEQLLGKETLRADLTAIKVMAIGAATAAALQLLDIEVAVTPERRYDSESLLDSKALQDVAGKRLVIFRGEGGRTLLADTLRQRGAQIDYAEVYRRIQPRTDVQPLLDAWQAEKIQVVTVTSNEALQNLYNMLNDEGRQKLLATPLVVMSQRTAELAQHLGFKHTPLVSAQASVTGLVAALLKWKQHKQA
jgi:uroporphyrinogen-III synthase